LEKSAKATKPKKCPVCGDPFTPFRPLQKVCGHACAIELAQKQRTTKERKEYREQKTKAKSRNDWMREAQTSFNAFIRARDDDFECISCGRVHTGQYHAGHYRPTSTTPALRFHELNVHKQCQPCNTHLHGNILGYRQGLIKKIGHDLVDWLEGPHEPAKYSIEDLKEIKRVYKLKLKELQNENRTDRYEVLQTKESHRST